MSIKSRVLDCLMTHFKTTYVLKLTASEVRELVKENGIDVENAYLMTVISDLTRQGYLYSVKKGEYMMGHRGSYSA